MRKKNTLIISIIVLLCIIFGFTSAWYRWTSNNTDVTFNIEGITVTYSAGENITGVKLLPVTTLEKGLTDGTAIEKTITVSGTTSVYLTLNMDIEILDDGLKHDTFIYQLYKGNSMITSGNFANYKAGDSIVLLSHGQVNTTATTYKLYIWIDGSRSNPVSMGNQNYKFVLHANATDERPNTASDFIISLFNGDTYAEGEGNGVYATNAYQVNGETKYHEYRYVGGEVNNYVKFNNDL